MHVRVTSRPWPCLCSSQFRGLLGFLGWLLGCFESPLASCLFFHAPFSTAMVRPTHTTTNLGCLFGRCLHQPDRVGHVYGTLAHPLCHVLLKCCRTCSAGLELGVCPMQNKGLLFLGPFLVLTRLSGLSSWRREPAMTGSFSVCPSSMSRPSTPVPMTWLFYRLSRTFLVSTVFPTRLEGSPSCPCCSVALVCCLLLKLLSQRIGHLGKIVCLSFVSTCRMRRKLSSMTLRPRSRKRPAFALLPQLTPSSALRIGRPPAGVSSVTAHQRRPRKRTGPPTFVCGWQGAAAATVARRACAQLLSTLDPSSAALLRSQQGPFASRFLTTVPTSPALDYPSQLFRRLRLPLPLTARTCRPPCSVCPSFGAAVALWRERRVCREADMNRHVERVDDRRLEVAVRG